MLYTFGFFPLFSGLILYMLYLKQIKSFPRAIGITPDELVTEGIYSITRNPQSLGRAIGLIGIAIIGRSYYALLLAIYWILINHIYILIEESFLESKFGELYLHYCSITPRYYKVTRNNGLSKSL
jgi:protein-S-isoprenylcysteine O-methyltransferase Ste14